MTHHDAISGTDRQIDWEGKDHNQNDAVKGNEQYYTKARFKR